MPEPSGGARLLRSGHWQPRPLAAHQWLYEQMRQWFFRINKSVLLNCDVAELSGWARSGMSNMAQLEDLN